MSLPQIFTNHLLKDSLVNVQILSIDFLITPTVRYRSLWLAIIFHSQSTESFNQNPQKITQQISFDPNWENRLTHRSTVLH